ncbi:MAG: hypothetical protein JWM35_2349 [Verrucomicrobia bacterium]|nr:hypothetical protein [Verrucomicrobiota bacterium]
MKKLLSLFCLTTVVAFAQVEPPSTFPGVKTVMSPEDFARAGLSGLTPEQLGLIDAAIIRHYSRTVATAANKQAADIVQKNTTEQKRSFLSHFGMPDLSFSQDWREVPSLKAHCTGWVGGNSFKLDNGQVWEGLEPIDIEVAGKDIEIQARPSGAFALAVNGENTTIRVHRIR